MTTQAPEKVAAVPAEGAAAATTAAAQAQAAPPATDPAVDYAARLEALEKRTNALASENGRLKAKVSALPNADAFVEAFDASEQVRADLIAKGITEDVLAELTPKALKAMHKSLVGQAPVTAATLQADIAAAKAAAPPAGGNGTGFTTTAARGGGAPGKTAMPTTFDPRGGHVNQLKKAIAGQ